MNDSSINSFLCDGQQADRLTHGSLFSGIGGFDLAAEWMGWKNVFHCEWNEFAQKILKQHFPNTISYGDITKTDFTIHRGTIDILTGGFPCQPYSLAGKRKGKEDERHLWPEMLRAIREIQPGYIVGENVYGLINWNGGLVFNEVQTDLENEGYEIQPVILPACAVNAPHRRDRIWFVAFNAKCKSNGRHSTRESSGIRLEMERDKLDKTKREESTNNIKSSSSNDSNTSNSGAEILRQKRQNTILSGEYAANSENIGLQRSKQANGEKGEKPNDKQFNGCSRKRVGTWEQWPTQSPICRRNDGVSNRMDRIKALGNAIVPQVALQIFKAIQIADRQKREEKTINTVKHAHS